MSTTPELETHWWVAFDGNSMLHSRVLIDFTENTVTLASFNGRGSYPTIYTYKRSAVEFIEEITMDIDYRRFDPA